MSLAARILLALLSGVLIFLSFAPLSFAELGLVALVPLLVAVGGQPAGEAAALGWLCGLVSIGVGYSWVQGTIARFQGVPVTAAFPYFAGFFTYHALQIAVFAAGQAWSRRVRNALLVVAPAWWVVVEWAFPRVVPWHFGAVFGGGHALGQVADLGGVYGVGFLAVLVNAAIANLVLSWGTRRRAAVLAAVPVVAVAAAWSAYGMARDPSSMPEAESGRAVEILIVQGGAEPRTAANPDGDSWSAYAELTRAHRRRAERTADLVVWGETVVKSHLRERPDRLEKLEALAGEVEAPLLLGALDRVSEASPSFNSAYVILPQPRRGGAAAPDAGPALQVYHKVTLVPFGEYLPGRELLPWLRRWRTTGAFVAGERKDPLRLPLARRDGGTGGTVAAIAPSICFEAVLPGDANRAVRAGAMLLANLTNDAWFGGGMEPVQHLQLATLRALETRRWMVRASNSGISAIIAPSGEVVASLGVGEVGVLEGAIELRTELTPYVRWGDWVVVFSAVILVGVFAFTRKSR